MRSLRRSTSSCLDTQPCFHTPDTIHHSDRECSPLTDCTDDQYIAKEHTRTSDRVCVDLTHCTEDEFQATPPSKYADRVCKLFTECEVWEFVVPYMLGGISSEDHLTVSASPSQNAGYGALFCLFLWG